MLELLRIKHLALIDDLELEFSSGLNVITGESGAGKSFILKAMDFILGEKIETAMVRPGAEEARVEALFVVDGEELIIRRELSGATGRSRLFVNDQLSSKEKIASLHPMLLQITSQHGQQKLLRPATHLQILDYFLPDDGLVLKFESSLEELRNISRQREELSTKMADLLSRREMLEFQRREIEQVEPLAGEEEELLQRKERVRAVADSAAQIEEGLTLLHIEGGLFDSVARLQIVLQQLASGHKDLQPNLENVIGFREVLRDIDTNLRQLGRVQNQEENLDEIERRLWELAQLKRKLNRTLPQILSLQEEIDANLSFLDESGLEEKRLQKLENEKKEELVQICEQLNAVRQETAKVLEKRIQEQLYELGFPEYVKTAFVFTDEEVFSGVIQKRPRLFWIPNPGQPPLALDKIASGGELSRFLLAIAELRVGEEQATLVFDEVDAGIGGNTLRKVGQSLRNLAGERQIILISHWPQLAELADAHFLVQKTVRDNNTFTSCHFLSEEERRKELARMKG